MKEYVVLELKCDKDLTIADIYAKVTERVAHNRNLFVLQNLKLDRMTKSNQNLYNSLRLERFAYTVIPEHLRNVTDYETRRFMHSNLDDNWVWHNPNPAESLSEEELRELITLLDKLKKADVSTMLLAFDEIAWDGSKVGKGTYGYEKADSTYNLGWNYLSNAVLVGRTYNKSEYTVYISCEKRFRDLSVVQELADSLGHIKRETSYFAPEDDNEREEWNKTAAQAEVKFKNAMEGIDSLPLEKFEKMGTAGTSKKIDIKKYVKTYLCTDGWKLRKARPDEWSILVAKDKEDATVTIGVSPWRNGHQVQTCVYYRSEKFKFVENIKNAGYITDAHEDQIEIFFRDTVIIRDYLNEAL